MPVNVISRITYSVAIITFLNSIIDWKGFQKFIGYADVKSAPVHFYVTRNSNFNTKHTPIPFDVEVVNEGNAMNLTSGIFTVPRPGIYFFSFAGVARFLSSSTVDFWSRLFLNGNLIGASNVAENKGPVDQYSPMSFQWTLNLKKGDQLWMEINYSGSASFLYESNDGNHRTHFTGFMLEEEIVASLWGSSSSAKRNIFDLNIFVSCQHEILGKRNFKGEGKKIHSILVH